MRNAGESDLVLLDPALVPGVRRRSLPAGRSWCIVSGDTLRQQPELRRQLTAGLRPIAEKAFPRATDGYLDVLAGDQRLQTLSALALLRTPQGQLGGMLSYVVGEWAGRRCFYASGALLYPGEQGGGLVSDGYAMLMRDELLKSPLRSLFAVVRTPNPVVYAQWERGIRLTGGHVDPRPGAVVPGYIRDLARELAVDQGFGDDFDTERLIARGCYRGGVVEGGTGPYDARPRCGNPELDGWFAERLGPDDAMLLVARLSLHRVAAIVGDRVLRRRLGRIGRHARTNGAIRANAPADASLERT